MQAYCRLHRLGQEREVEVVELVAGDTIDQFIVDLQKRKTDEIEQFIRSKNGLDRKAAISLLSTFESLTQEPGGGDNLKAKGNPGGKGRSSRHGDED